MNQLRRTANTVSCEDDCDAFSVESLQNRVIVATGSADDTFGDIDFFSRKHGTIDTADDNQISYSFNDDYECSPRSLSSATSTSSTGAVPPEIALMHQKTNSLLDSIRSNGPNRDIVSLPSMEDEHTSTTTPYNEEHKQYHDLEEEFAFDLDSYDMEERSYASYVSDDDGMKKEVDQLELAILEIHKEMANSSDFELMIGAFEDDMLYDEKDRKHPMEFTKAKLLRLAMIVIASYSFLSVMKSKFMQYNTTLEHDATMLESVISSV